MAPQLGAPSYCSGREGRQSHWLSCPNKILLSGCACTSHLDWVAQHTSFHDFEILSGLVV